MKYLIVVAAAMVLLYGGSLARTNVDEAGGNDKHLALVAWTSFKVSAANAGIMFPKQPVMIGHSDDCSEMQGAAYFAYADEAVYEFRYYAKGGVIPKRCSDKSRFGQGTLDRRLAKVADYKPGPVSASDGLVGIHKAKIFRSETSNEISTRWIGPDLDNDRWLELSVSYRPDKKPGEKRFVDSLNLRPGDGVEIGLGSSATLGDMSLAEKPVSSDAGEGISRGLILKAKPRPGYTEIARENDTTGTVILRTTFLANDGIGAVSVIKALPYGLTEQSISAAKRIVFLPSRKNGNPVAVSKQIEYTFSIY